MKLPKETRAEEIGGDIERRLGTFDPEEAEILDEIVHDIADAIRPPAAPEATEEWFVCPECRHAERVDEGGDGICYQHPYGRVAPAEIEERPMIRLWRLP